MAGFKYDLLCVLGGGRTNSGDLTELSCQRLDKAAELFLTGAAEKILVMGGYKSTFLPGAIRFRKTGAFLRKEYLTGKRKIKPEDIIELPRGLDTIDEAYAIAGFANERGSRRVLVVTSDKHLSRTLFVFKEIFRRVFGKKKFILASTAAPCGDLLDEEIERQSLILTQEFFKNLPASDMPDFQNHETWYKNNRDFYKKLRELQNPTGKPGLQAYWGVRYKEETGK